MHQFIVQLYKQQENTRGKQHEGWATASLNRATVLGKCLCLGKHRPTDTFVGPTVKFRGRDGEEED